MKKIIILTVVLICALFALGACKQKTGDVTTDPTTSLKFTHVSGGYAVSGSSDSSLTKIVIPSTYKGEPVIEIANRAFQGYELLRIVVIPSCVKVIEEKAFEDCISLIGLFIGYNVPDQESPSTKTSELSKLGKLSFAICPLLEQIYFNGTMQDFKSIIKDNDKQNNCWNRNTPEPLRVECLDGTLLYKWNGGDNEPEEEPKQGTYCYIPTKVSYSGENGNCTISVKLNENNLPSEEIRTRYDKVHAIITTTYNSDGLRNKYVYTQKNEKGDYITVITSKYDGNGRLVEERQTDAEGKLELINVRSYDSNGNCIKIVSKDSEGRENLSIESTYDANGRLIKEKYIYSDKTVVVSTLSYDKSGRLIKKTSDDGSKTTFTYDNAGYLVKITDEGLYADTVYEISYDECENIKQISFTDISGKRKTFKFEYQYVYVPFNIQYDSFAAVESLHSAMEYLTYDFSQVP